MTTVIISGGFDPIHSGHIDYITAAAGLGDRLVVLLNSDDWLRRKKGYAFMGFDDRYRVLSAMGDVDVIHQVDDSDGTVLPGIMAVAMGLLPVGKKVIFANGGDRVNSNTPEVEWCLKEGVGVAFNIGGGKTQSSSGLLRPWKNCVRELWHLRKPGAATNSLYECHKVVIDAK
jgi:cytidyltransferase-like protein